MDAAWLDVVKERSQFLFLQLWSVRDWDLNARPFIYLAFTAFAVPDARIRKLCMAAALVGAAGLAVALIGSVVGPVAILVQGQAWRWVWIAVFSGALLLPVTALQVWRDEKCGPLCAILLVAAWAWPAADGTACVSLALLLWLARAGLSDRVATYFRYAAAVLGIAILAWILSGWWPTASRARARAGPIRIETCGAAAHCACVAGHSAQSNPKVPTFIAGMLAAFSICFFPAAFSQSRTLASAADIDEFSVWTKDIPPTSTVLVAPARDVGAFVWFTLMRPNYLAVDQSAGVVFSRATALEVQTPLGCAAASHGSELENTDESERKVRRQKR